MVFTLKQIVMKSKSLLFIALLMISAGCAEMQKVLQSAAPAPLTENDVVNGLKEALITGAKNSAGILGTENGYFGDATVKILLPDDAKVILDNLSKIPGGDNLVNDVVLRINRAAEDAAKEVAPIFVNSVTQMTISDAFNILNGPDNAATSYLQKTTYEQLYQLFKPKIQASTEKKIIGNISTKDSWNTLTSKWNSLANSVAGKLAGLKPVNTNLDDFLTARALSGMFLKVEGEELKIRKEVSARVTPILQKVFGTLDNKIN